MGVVLHSSARAEESGRTLLVLGDSLSAAYGIPMQRGWVSLLEDRLQRTGKGYRVVNASVSGETTRGGAGRLAALLGQHQPALVIIELGGNDGLRGVDLNQTQQHLERMVAASQAAGARVLLIGVRLPPNFGPAYRERFETVYADVAARFAIPLVPFLLQGVALRPELMQADGIHPRAEAQGVMLDVVWPFLEPMLTVATPCPSSC
jgi:acyl-CoA thioesterase-1